MHEAIIKTLCYSAVFKFPLTAVEIHQRLIGHKATLKQLTKVLQNLSISSQNGLYFLSKSHLNHRQEASRFSKSKLDQAKKIARLLKVFPSISAVYITGAVSAGNATASDDIDFMIITKSHSLWTTRFFTNSLLDLFHLRRRPTDIEFNNKVCLNLWLTIDTMQVPKTARNLYTAYEVIQAKLLWDRHHTHQAFQYQNRWINQYLPNIRLPAKPTIPKTTPHPSLIEQGFYYLQKTIMRAKITREKISLNQAFFHPRDTGMIVDQAYQKLLKKYL